MFLGVSCGSAWAQDAGAIDPSVTDPAKRLKVEELFKVMHLSANYDQLMTQMMSQSKQMVSGMLPSDAKPTAAQQKQVDEFEAKVNSMVTDSFSWKALQPEFVKMYADAYTYEDLDGMLIFYQSPVGQKVLNTQPELMKQSSAVAMAHMQALQPKMQQVIADFQKTMQAEKSQSK